MGRIVYVGPARNLVGRLELDATKAIAPVHQQLAHPESLSWSMAAR